MNKFTVRHEMGSLINTEHEHSTQAEARAELMAIGLFENEAAHLVEYALCGGTAEFTLDLTSSKRTAAVARNAARVAAGLPEVDLKGLHRITVYGD